MPHGIGHPPPAGKHGQQLHSDFIHIGAVTNHTKQDASMMLFIGS
jgi:hypothetical protein